MRRLLLTKSFRKPSSYSHKSVCFCNYLAFSVFVKWCMRWNTIYTTEYIKKIDVYKLKVTSCATKSHMPNFISKLVLTFSDYKAVVFLEPSKISNQIFIILRQAPQEGGRRGHCQGARGHRGPGFRIVRFRMQISSAQTTACGRDDVFLISGRNSNICGRHDLILLITRC